jgi:hypothetical protein
VNRTALDASAIGTPIRVLGFGRTKPGSTDTAGARFEMTTSIDGVDDHSIWFEDADKHTCDGDSGGPALMTRNGVESIAAVTSWVEYAFCTGTDHAARTDAAAGSWIDAVIAKHDPGFVPLPDGAMNESDGAGGSSGEGSPAGETPGTAPQADTTADGTCTLSAPRASRPGVFALGVFLLGLLSTRRSRRMVASS